MRVQVNLGILQRSRQLAEIGRRVLACQLPGYIFGMILCIHR